MPNSRIWVAKIGGSLHGDRPRLADWLAALLADTQRQWLIVPGGGPYADAVRRAQQAEGFDDVEAHRRALQAMARYAQDLARLAPTLVPAQGLAACDAVAAGRPVLWYPTVEDARAFAGLPADWRVTSDSLAHALARRVRAEAVLLVKSAPARIQDVGALAADGYVDAHLPQLMADAPGLRVYWSVAAPRRDIPFSVRGWPTAQQAIFPSQTLKSPCWTPIDPSVPQP